MAADNREGLLRAAAAILSNEGLSALTIRNVAKAVNVSTKMIYTHFGGKDGLLDALYLYSFASLTDAFLSHGSSEDPRRKLAALMSAYRSFALNEPAFYSVMFGDLGRSWEAPHSSRKKAWMSFRTLRLTVSDYLGDKRSSEATRITYLLWAAAHGVVSLETRKLFDPPQRAQQLYWNSINSICRSEELPPLTLEA